MQAAPGIGAIIPRLICCAITIGKSAPRSKLTATFNTFPPKVVHFSF